MGAPVIHLFFLIPLAIMAVIFFLPMWIAQWIGLSDPLADNCCALFWICVVVALMLKDV